MRRLVVAARIGSRGLTAAIDPSRVVWMKPTLIAAEPARHGKPAAQLIPLDAGDVASIREAIDTVATIRKHLCRNGVTLAGMLDNGGTARDLAHANHKY